MLIRSNLRWWSTQDLREEVISLKRRLELSEQVRLRPESQQSCTNRQKTPRGHGDERPTSRLPALHSREVDSKVFGQSVLSQSDRLADDLEKVARNTTFAGAAVETPTASQGFSFTWRHDSITAVRTRTRRQFIGINQRHSVRKSLTEDHYSRL